MVDNQTTEHLNLLTPEGMAKAMQIIRSEELERFMGLMSQFIVQIDDDALREQMEGAFKRMEDMNVK